MCHPALAARSSFLTPLQVIFVIHHCSLSLMLLIDIAAQVRTVFAKGILRPYCFSEGVALLVCPLRQIILYIELNLCLTVRFLLCKVSAHAELEQGMQN
jgi:hypothetical protein